MAKKRNGQKSDKSNKSGKKSGKKSGNKSKKKKNKNGRKGQKITARTYWGGHAGELPEPPVVRPAPDASAIVRSLGTPPLPGQAHNADQLFQGIYDRSVGLATALAAAGDLLDT